MAEVTWTDDEDDEHYEDMSYKPLEKNYKDMGWDLETLQDYYDDLGWSLEDYGKDMSSLYRDPEELLSKRVSENSYVININSLNEVNTPIVRVHEGIIKRVLKKVVPWKWAWFKWLFIVLNVLFEVCQATIAQENAKGKVSTMLYIKLSVITSSCCLFMSLVEIIREGKESQVVWRKRGYCCWFYYPGSQGQPRLFGRFSLYFGIVSSMVQLVVNLVSLGLNKNVIKFDLLPLLLSSGYLIAEIIGQREKPERSMV